ncbi:MAG: hypothetical protein MUD14_12505, partial [Hydrococcus sp. Prado102]|nr:hypothetical protein [Hydrococcus sp. Prado102]
MRKAEGRNLDKASTLAPFGREKLVLLPLWLKLLLLGLLTVASWQTVQPQAVSLKSFSCPADVESLTNLLIQDIPGYANRVIQRVRKLDRPVYLSTYVIIAGRPEFKPLPLVNRQYNPVLPDTSQQVFFTTLERRY